MAYTFGAGSGDDLNTPAAQTIGVSGGSCLYAGWWYPTTLTATRCYCSFGNVSGMVVDTTTDELRFLTNNATTPGIWNTTGADITVNKWWFIAFLHTANNTGPAGAFRCWVGSADAHPLEVTVNVVTAPVGNFTGNANCYVGNKGTGSLAFQGDIGCMSCIGNNTVGNRSPFTIETAGTITDAEADNTLNRWVRPLYLGTPRGGMNSVQGIGNAFTMIHFPLTLGNNVYQRCHDFATSATIGVAAVNGATLVASSPPRSPPANWVLEDPRSIGST